VGWSFGGAVVIRAGVREAAVVGVVTVASQTYGTEEVGLLAPKSLLLLHGTADRTLPDRCSRDLYARAGEPKELALYPGDNHGLDGHRGEMLEKLQSWSARLLRGEDG
jgi:dienelactone hydrolase